MNGTSQKAMWMPCQASVRCSQVVSQLIPQGQALGLPPSADENKQNQRVRDVSPVSLARNGAEEGVAWANQEGYRFV